MSNRNDKKTLESIYDCYYKIIKWKIDDLIWIDVNTFAFRVYDKVEYKDNDGKEIKKLINERYLKAKILE